MINNRQGGRRGRGRNPRPQGGAPRGDQGNRIDNRSRGNASQLHEKYKTLARDAQTQGDRVLTEYYLQFADHYFRVLNESRARFDEQRRTQDNGRDFDGDYDGDDTEAYADGEGDERDDQPQQQPQRRDEQQPRREGRDNRDGRDGRDGRDDRNQRREFRQPERADEEGYDPNGQRFDRAEPRADRSEPRADRNEQRADRPDRNDQPRGERPDRQQRRPRRDFAGNGNGEDQQPERIDAGVLPPAFGAEAAPVASPEPDLLEGVEEAPRRRRPRRPRAEPGNDTTNEAAA